MAFLDDAIRQLTQGANGSPPLAAALQELLAGNAQSAPAPAAKPGVGATSQPPATPSAMPQVDPNSPEAQIFAGLNGLLKQLQDGGLDEVVKTWVGPGQNQPVHPKDLGQALGADAINKMADKAGCNQQDLLSQLSKALPGLIDQLTAKGRLPTLAELQQQLSKQ